MKNLEIFYPAMCCSTDICNPSIDANLMRVAAVINMLKDKGIIIKSYGLSDESEEFVSNKTIKELLQKEGEKIFPVTLLEGEIVKMKEYPTDEEFSEWLGIKIVEKAKSSCGHGCESGGCS